METQDTRANTPKLQQTYIAKCNHCGYETWTLDSAGFQDGDFCPECDEGAIYLQPEHYL